MGEVPSGLEVRLEQPRPPREPAGVTSLLEPEGEVLLIGANRSPEPVFVRPAVRFVRGGWIPPSLDDGPQVLQPGQSGAFRVTLPLRPVEQIGLQEVAPANPARTRWRPGRITPAPSIGGSGHPFDLEDVGGIVVGALVYAFALRGLTQWLYDLGTPGLWFAVVAGVVVVVFYAVLTHFYTRLRVWSRDGVPASSSAARAGELVIMTCGITYLAVAVTALLLRYGLVGASPPSANGVDAVEGLERYFGLSLLDSIPVLHIPETFGLIAPVKYDGLAMGLVVTAYRLVLLLPAAALAVSLFNDVRLWPTRAGQAEVVSLDECDPAASADDPT